MPRPALSMKDTSPRCSRMCGFTAMRASRCASNESVSSPPTMRPAHVTTETSPTCLVLKAKATCRLPSRRHLHGADLFHQAQLIETVPPLDQPAVLDADEQHAAEI